jgi:hypothetical protein
MNNKDEYSSFDILSACTLTLSVRMGCKHMYCNTNRCIAMVADVIESIWGKFDIIYEIWTFINNICGQTY